MTLPCGNALFIMTKGVLKVFKVFKGMLGKSWALGTENIEGQEAHQHCLGESEGNGMRWIYAAHLQILLSLLDQPSILLL